LENEESCGFSERSVLTPEFPLKLLHALAFRRGLLLRTCRALRRQAFQRCLAPLLQRRFVQSFAAKESSKFRVGNTARFVQDTKTLYRAPVLGSAGS
jgi:hypothetical protein